MKFADEIMNNKKARIEQKLKEHNERVNEEMLAIEKAINTYENDDKNTKPYIDIQMIIKTDQAKESLKEHRFFIDKVSQYIPYGTTRVYLSEDAYKEAVGKYELKKSLKYSEYGKITNPLKNTNNIKVEPIIIGDKDSIKLTELLNKIAKLHSCERSNC